jgi:hypothetical protein
VSLRVTGEKLVFDKTQPQQLTDTIAVSCFWLGMVIHRFRDPNRLSCWFEPYVRAAYRTLPECRGVPYERHKGQPTGVRPFEYRRFTEGPRGEKQLAPS